LQQLLLLRREFDWLHHPAQNQQHTIVPAHGVKLEVCNSWSENW
jgi:hypothetical protein